MRVQNFKGKADPLLVEREKKLARFRVTHTYHKRVTKGLEWLFAH